MRAPATCPDKRLLDVDAFSFLINMFANARLLKNLDRSPACTPGQQLTKSRGSTTTLGIPWALRWRSHVANSQPIPCTRRTGSLHFRGHRSSRSLFAPRAGGDRLRALSGGSGASLQSQPWPASGRAGPAVEVGIPEVPLQSLGPPGDRPSPL